MTRDELLRLARHGHLHAMFYGYDPPLEPSSDDWWRVQQRNEAIEEMISLAECVARGHYDRSQDLQPRQDDERSPRTVTRHRATS